MSKEKVVAKKSLLERAKVRLENAESVDVQLTEAVEDITHFLELKLMKAENEQLTKAKRNVANAKKTLIKAEETLVIGKSKVSPDEWYDQIKIAESDLEDKELYLEGLKNTIKRYERLKRLI